MLPVDIIEVCNLRKVASMNKGCRVQVHITRSKYQKQDDTPLYLTKDHTAFSAKCYTQEDNDKFLAQAGLIPHTNCTISLPMKACRNGTRIKNHLQLLHPEEEIECNKISWKLPSTKDGNLQLLKLTDLSIGVYDVKEIIPRKSPFGRFIISIH